MQFRVRVRTGTAKLHIEARPKYERVESGRFFVGAVSATAVAACFAIIGASLQGRFVQGAMYALVAGIPFCALYLLVTAPGQRERHHVSALMRWMPTLGILSITVGLSLLFEYAVAGAGLIFVVFALGCAWVGVQSAERAKPASPISAGPISLSAGHAEDATEDAPKFS